MKKELDSTNYEVEVEYSGRFPKERLYHHSLFPNFFMFKIDRKVRNAVWLLDDVKCPEYILLNNIDLP